MDDIEFRLAKLALAPGDVLVVKVAGRLTQQMVDAIGARLRSTIGDGHKLLIIDDLVNLSVLTRAAIEARS